MRIRISDLSPEGLVIKEELPLERLNQRMNAVPGNDVLFSTPPKVDLTVTKEIGGAATKGTICSTIKQPCSRCLKEIPRDVSASTDFILKERTSIKTDQKDEEDEIDVNANFDDDVGISFYEGDHVELEELLQEQLILEINPFGHPEELPDGKCSSCGLKPVELSTADTPTTKFGDLLAKASSMKRK
jgi:uncharacterized metal-binding protein YceD (DUF177 family)